LNGGLYTNPERVKTTVGLETTGEFWMNMRSIFPTSEYTGGGFDVALTSSPVYLPQLADGGNNLAL